MDLPMSLFPGMACADAGTANAVSGVIGSGATGKDLAGIIQSLLQKNDGKLDPALVQLLQSISASSSNTPFDGVLNQIMSKAPALAQVQTPRDGSAPVTNAPIPLQLNKEGQELWTEMERALAALIQQQVPLPHPQVIPLNLDGNSRLSEAVQGPKGLVEGAREALPAGSSNPIRTPFTSKMMDATGSQEVPAPSTSQQEALLFDLTPDSHVDAQAPKDPRQLEKALAPTDPAAQPTSQPQVQVVSVKVEAPKPAPRVKPAEGSKSSEVRTESVAVAPPQVSAATATQVAAPAPDVAGQSAPDLNFLQAVSASAIPSNLDFAKSVVYQVFSEAAWQAAPNVNANAQVSATAAPVGAEKAALQATQLADQVSHLQAELRMVPPQHGTRPAFSLDQMETETENAPLAPRVISAGVPADALQTEQAVTAVSQEQQTQLDAHTDDRQQTFDFARPTNTKSSGPRDAYSPVSWKDLNGTPARTIEARRIEPQRPEVSEMVAAAKAGRGVGPEVRAAASEVKQGLPAEFPSTEKISDDRVTISIAPAPRADFSSAISAENHVEPARIPVMQMADSIRDAQAQGKTTMEIILKPEGLGTLKIKMIQTSNDASGAPNYRLEITAQSAEAHTLLKNSMQELSKALGNWSVGLDYNGQNTVHTPQSSSSSGSDQNYSGREGQAQRSPQHQDRSSGREKSDEKFSLNLESE